MSVGLRRGNIGLVEDPFKHVSDSGGLVAQLVEPRALVGAREAPRQPKQGLQGLPEAGAYLTHGSY